MDFAGDQLNGRHRLGGIAPGAPLGAAPNSAAPNSTAPISAAPMAAAPMAASGRMVLRPISIETLAAHHPAPGPCVRHVHSLGPERIALRPLAAGSAMFAHWRLREFPEQGCHQWQSYLSYAPPLFVVHGAMVHGSSGIVAIGQHVIAETLVRTSPATDGYERLAKDIAFPPAPVRKLAGTHLSLLTGGAACFAHALLDGLARSAVVPLNYLAEISSVLLPAQASLPRDAGTLLDLPPSIEHRTVRPGEWMEVETLILPLSVMGECVPHPVLRGFYRQMASSVANAAATPPRLLIRRSPTGRRPLLNEDDLAQRLARLGFVAIAPESYSMADQIRLFRGAEVIVGAHGGALANIGFCRPGTKIFELQMDARLSWEFRHLAALCGLDYDCLPGRVVPPWPALGPATDQAGWQISPQHVAAALAQALPLPLHHSLPPSTQPVAAAECVRAA